MVGSKLKLMVANLVESYFALEDRLRGAIGLFSATPNLRSAPKHRPGNITMRGLEDLMLEILDQLDIRQQTIPVASSHSMSLVSGSSFLAPTLISVMTFTPADVTVDSQAGRLGAPPLQTIS